MCLHGERIKIFMYRKLVTEDSINMLRFFSTTPCKHNFARIKLNSLKYSDLFSAFWNERSIVFQNGREMPTQNEALKECFI